MFYTNTGPDFPVINMPGKKGTFSDMLIYTSEAWTWCYLATVYLYIFFPLSQSAQPPIILAGSPAPPGSGLPVTLAGGYPKGKIAQE